MEEERVNTFQEERVGGARAGLATLLNSSAEICIFKRDADVWFVLMYEVVCP